MDKSCRAKVSLEHVAMLDQVPEDFEICACRTDIDEAKSLCRIGAQLRSSGTSRANRGDVSVTSADPQIVSDTASAVREANEEVMVPCGAGIKSGPDVSRAIELGVSGVLLASGVTKSSNPKEALEDLVSLL